MHWCFKQRLELTSCNLSFPVQCQKQEEGLVSLEKRMYKANGRMKIIGFNYVDKVDIDGSFAVYTIT